VARKIHDAFQPWLVVRKGMNRRVILVGKYAFKFPRIVDDQTFVRGMLHNILEHTRWKLSHKHKALMPIYWCSPLGLMLIQRRCTYILYRKLTPLEVKSMPFTDVDNNGDNAGIYNGHVVLFDYGGENMHLIVE
jgi:hypothetical protein